MSFFSNLESAAVKLFKSFSSLVKTVLLFADELVDKFKAFEATPVGEAVVGTIETLAKDVVPPQLVAAFQLWLPGVLVDLGWAVKEAGKSDDEILNDALIFIQSKTGNSKAVLLHALNALVSTWLAENQGGTLPIQQALTAVQIVHDPSIAQSAA